MIITFHACTLAFLMLGNLLTKGHKITFASNMVNMGLKVAIGVRIQCTFYSNNRDTYGLQWERLTYTMAYLFAEFIIKAALTKWGTYHYMRCAGQEPGQTLNSLRLLYNMAFQDHLSF